MAKADRTRQKGIGSRILGLLNPIRDPSLLVALILTVIEEGSPSASPLIWVLFALLNWMAVKALIWLLVNFAFSFIYLARKGWWIARHPRLGWRLLDALGTEEIIIGGLRPDMFATDEGGLHEGQLGYAAMGSPAFYSGMLSGSRASRVRQDGYDDGYGDERNGYGDQQSDEQSEHMREAMATYSRLIADWMAFTEEKWRAVSDSQLGWKPLRGRWNGWEEIYGDSFTMEDRADDEQNDPMVRRFDNAQGKGSAASAVACFLRDLDHLRQGLTVIESDAPDDAARLGGFSPQQPVSQRTGKSSIIRNPMIVDAD